MIKALIFDFDGLILDTETTWIEVWKTIFAEHGFHYPIEQWSLTVGGWGHSTFDPALALNELAGDSLDLAALRLRHRSAFDDLILPQPVLPGVREYLADAPRLGLRLALASSSDRTWVESHLGRLGLLDCFEKIICGDDVPAGRTKPHPDLFLKALEDMQVSASEALVFEDSPNGVKAARDAGIRVVAVPNPATAQLSLENADLKLPSLAGLPLEDLLRRFNA